MIERAQGRRRRTRILAAASIASAGLAAGLWFLSTQRHCLGDCGGALIDCAGIDAWVAEVQADEVWPNGDSSRRSVTHRARVPYRGGQPCGAERWGIVAFDARSSAHLREVMDTDGTVTVSLRYRNAHADTEVVLLEAIGIELSGWELLRATQLPIEAIDEFCEQLLIPK